MKRKKDLEAEIERLRAEYRRDINLAIKAGRKEGRAEAANIFETEALKYHSNVPRHIVITIARRLKE